jgi:hypothetical protein
MGEVQSTMGDWLAGSRCLAIRSRHPTLGGSKARGVAHSGPIDRTAQCNLCNLLRSDTPMQLALVDVSDAPKTVTRTNGVWRTDAR